MLGSARYILVFVDARTIAVADRRPSRSVTDETEVATDEKQSKRLRGKTCRLNKFAIEAFETENEEQSISDDSIF